MYLKGERKPSVDFVRNICATQHVSADWLLGLSPPETATTAIVGSGNTVIANNTLAAHSTLAATAPTGAADCENCKYKRLAEALKAVQSG